ncbi:MAG TPA: hypothetical protein VKV24_12145, partial [Casimicrobiaceae bacterium]|nr:hypothetical protein [Casimicrobiaceae bacterium]
MTGIERTSYNRASLLPKSRAGSLGTFQAASFFNNWQSIGVGAEALLRRGRFGVLRREPSVAGDSKLRVAHTTLV